MFRKWLKENNLSDYSYSGELFPTAENRDFWNGKRQEKYIKKAEKCLGYNWPLIKASDFIAFHTKGSRAQQEKPYFERRAVLNTLVFGELFEYEDRFIPDIIDGILLLCEETTWTLSAHKHPLGAPYDIQAIDAPYIDLFAAETGAQLAIIYYLLKDKIKAYCPEMLERIEYEINRRIITPYLERLDFIWMCNTPGWKVDNWNPWIISNILTVFLLMPVSEQKLIKGIEKMIYEINGIYVTYAKDGGCDEGATYWSVSQGSMFEFCEQLYIATNGKIDFFKDEIIKNNGKYGYRAYIGNGYFTNFADGSTTLRGMPVGWILYMYGKRINDERLSALAKELIFEPQDFENDFNFERDAKSRRILFDLIYEDEIKNSLDFEPIDNCILPDIENSFVHKDGWFYASKGGHNAERHNHYDVGSFIAYYEGKPVLVDPSCGTYDAKTFSLERYDIWTMNSHWHNLPVVNGFGQTGEYEQSDGKIYKADSFSMVGNETKISFAKAYRKEAKLCSLERTVDACDGILVKDTFEFENDQNIVSEHFVTPLSVRIKDGKAIIGEKFVLSVSEEGEFSADSVDFEGDKVLESKWNTNKMNRIKFDFKASKKAKAQFKLQLIERE